MPKRQDTVFVNRVFNGKYHVYVPTWQRPAPGIPVRFTSGHLKGTEGFDYYEPMRTLSMEENLKGGDVLFDIGVADGWLSAIYAGFVGAENMCLFEPSSDSWPNIRAIWEENNLPVPRATFCGFVSDQTHLRQAPWLRDGWPEPAYDDDLQEELHFRTIKERSHDTAQITLDDFVARTGIVPRALSIDVEGAELLVLRGAREILKKYQPIIWLSLHTINGAIFYTYGHSVQDILALTAECGYRMPEFLEISGDEHWVFFPEVEYLKEAT